MGQSSTLRDARPIDPARAIDEAEHVATFLRFRRALVPGLAIYASSVAFDVGNAANLAPGSLGALLALRVAGTALVCAVVVRFFTGARPGRTELRLLVAGLFAAWNAIFGAMAIAASGITSPYFGGAMVMLTVFGALINEHWKRGLVDALGAFLAYPATLLASAAFVPRIAAQLRDPVARTIFSADVGNLFIAYVVVVVAGHLAWGLRRQVFETRSLGRYRLRARIGAGGMGEVWAAHDATLKRDVAVKILSGDRAVRDANAVARFEREVRATTELLHPNTVRVFDYGVTDDGVWFYAMELLEGESLAALVAREGPLDPARTVHLVAQAARALAEAHDKGIVHRDVKPENLFVARLGGETDFVKVLDFGIAQVASGERDPKLTATGALVGTPQWLSPEAIRGAAIDPRTDVYALGAVLYFALAGHPPFDAATGALVVTAHLHELPQPPSAKRGAPLPADVEAIVMRCLAKDPAARFASGRELAQALATCAVAGTWRPRVSLVPPVSAAAASLATADTAIDVG